MISKIPIQSDNVPNGHLVHVLPRYVSNKQAQIQRLAIEKYRTSGLGINFSDVINSFGYSKRNAQHILKMACNTEILFRLPRRTKPQFYFPAAFKADILEKIKKTDNLLNEPTGLNHSKLTSSSRLDHIERQQAQSFLDILQQLKFMPLSIHKIQLETAVDQEIYNTINHEFNEKNKMKIHEERIGCQIKGSPNVKYLISPNGKILVYITCSDRPFKLENDNDFSFFFAFLGQVRDRLLYVLNDISERYVLSIMDWHLIGCDLNKDVSINDRAQLTLPDIQLKTADRVFRCYVKSLGDKAVDRCEESVTMDLPMQTALDDIRFPFKSEFKKIMEGIDIINQKLESSK
jgi:hypothetical protein